jgi:hypothetical protein
MAIDPKCDHTLYGVLITKTKTLSNTFALISIGFYFSLFQVEHLIISWSSPCTMIFFLAPSLGLYQPHLIHTLSIEVSTKVSSISQNQTRDFNLPFFVIDDNLFSQRFLIKFFWIHVACPSILPCVKDMDKFHTPELVAIAPPTYVIIVWI